MKLASNLLPSWAVRSFIVAASFLFGATLATAQEEPAPEEIPAAEAEAAPAEAEAAAAETPADGSAASESSDMSEVSSGTEPVSTTPTDTIPVATGETPAEVPADTTQLDTIEVTGSRIRRTDYETAQPVAVVTRDDIERTGLTNLGDILQRIPAAGSALNRNFNNGGNGQTEIDLRNLGSIRVLVLVNGHRWVSGTSLADSAVDLNTIPVSVIDRIEVLKDGASAIYGSDAITGVVNVITRKDFSGFTFGTQLQAFDDGKGRSAQTNLSMGTVSGKTSMFVDFNFVRQKELLAGDRGPSSTPQEGTNIITSGRNFENEFVFTRGSAIGPEGYFIFVPEPQVQAALNATSTGPGSAGEKCPVLVGPQALAGDPVGLGLPVLPTETLGGVNICLVSPIRGEEIRAATAGGTDTLGTAAQKLRYNGAIFGEPDIYQYNFAPKNYLLTPFEQDSVFTQINHSFLDWLNLNSQILYTVSRSDQKLAEEPLRAGDLFGAAPFSQAYIARDQIYNPLGQDIGRSTADQGLIGLGGVVRRMIEAGPRIANRENTTIFIKNQFDGSFDALNRLMSYDLGYSYGRTKRVVDVFGSFNMERVARALGPTTSGDGLTGCPSVADPNCVPLNLFAPVGGITQAELDYVMYKATETNTSEVQDVFVNFSTEIGELSGKLPYGILSAPIGIAGGLEYRQDSFDEIPDPFTTAGISSGLNGGATRGRQNVREAYVELDLPVVQDKYLAEELNLSMAARYTEYNTFDPKTTGKLGVRWKPVSDVLVRATYSEAFRAPNLQELFLGQTDSFPSVDDPCAVTDPVTGEPTDRPEGNIDDNCDAEGVPEQPATSSQTFTVFEGNRDLDPEVATTFTTGVVWSPEFIPDFNIYADYWRIDLDDFIGFVGPDEVLQACYEGDSNPAEFCDKIERSDTGQITRISASPVNFATLTTSGIDLAFDYVLPFAKFFPQAENWGVFKFAMDSQYLLDYTQKLDLPGAGGGDQFRGRDAGDQPLPELKINTTLAWNLNNFSASWTMRFIPGTVEECDDGLQPSLSSLGLCSNPDTDVDEEGQFVDGSDDSTNEYDDLFYHNFQFGYALPAYNAEFTVGVLNAFDQDPPISQSAFANSAPATLYETFGSRQPYLRLGVSF